MSDVLCFSDKRILLVDDDPMIHEIVPRYLAELGCPIAAITDQDDVMGQIDGIKPDLILLDVMMPSINGFDLCRQITARHDVFDQPVLMMTSLCGEADIANGFAAGAVDYITKPVKKSELLARVITHLRMAHIIKMLKRDNMELAALFGPMPTTTIM